MQVVDFHGELFGRDPVRTESDSRAALLQDPLQAHATYLCAPWSVLINQNRTDTISPFECHEAFTVCQHIHFARLIPLLKACRVRVLFTPHAVRSYPGLQVRAFPHSTSLEISPQPKRWLYSFIGYASHPLRKQLAVGGTGADVVIRLRRRWHFAASTNRAEAEREYAHILGTSRFSLCPRGSGPGTIRFWESLQAGAIPVVIADALQLPAGHDWDNTIIWCAEEKVTDVDRIIRGVSIRREEQLRESCLVAAAKFSGDRLVSPIRRYYGERAGG